MLINLLIVSCNELVADSDVSFVESLSSERRAVSGKILTDLVCPICRQYVCFRKA